MKSIINAVLALGKAKKSMIQQLYRKKSYLSCSFLHIVLVIVSFVTCAQAANDPSAYQTQIAVASYSSVDWQKAVVPALREVLAKVSGNPNITQSQVVSTAMAKPDSFVQSYNYIENSQTKSILLQVRFSPKAVDGLLQKAEMSDLTGDATSGVTADNSFSNTTPQSVSMVVSGVSKLQDYAAIIGYLLHIKGVTEVNSKQTQGDRVLLVLKINTTVDNLVSAIDNEGKLRKTPIKHTSNPAMTSLLSYRWVGSNQPAQIADQSANRLEAKPAQNTRSANMSGELVQSEQSAGLSVNQTKGTERVVVPGSVNSAPIVEAIPTAPGISNSSTGDSGQVQSFGIAPQTSFVSEESK